MASRFVPGGTNEDPTERDEAWLKAQKEIESKRQQTASASQQEGGKSLYETLQANKAAKQEAFEESIRLRNQFRSLDEDEVDFLDSVLESTRAKEAEVRKETTQQLDAFREQQREAEKSAVQPNASPEAEPAETWTAGPRKRKKGKESTIGGVKLRRFSTSEKQAAPTAPAKDAEPEKPTDTSANIGMKEDKKLARGTSATSQEDPADAARSQDAVEAQVPQGMRKESDSPKPPSPVTGGLGLVAYSSGEDEDD